MITLNFDGACWPNPGGRAGYGALVCRDDIIIAKISGSIPAGETSNNVAEYAALIAALTWLFDNGFDQEIIEACGDSMLVIKQIWGWPAGRKWKIKRGLYFENAQRAKELVSKFPLITGKWVPREENGEADLLSRRE